MKTFPIRTFLICATLWAIATQLMIFDYMKYSAKTELLEQAARALSGRADPHLYQHEKWEHL